MIENLTVNNDRDEESTRFHSEYQEVVKQIQKCVEENAHAAIDQAEYQKRYNALVEEYENIKNRMTEIEESFQENSAKRTEIRTFMQTLKDKEDLLTVFDESVFTATVEKIIIISKTRIKIVFKDKSEINRSL